MTSNNPAAAAGRSGRVDGEALVAMLAAAAAALEAESDVIDALNVYPVPDGDTGTNLHLTLAAGLTAAGALRTYADGRQSAAAVAGAAVEGTLRAARGNSGVIFSQWLAGFASALPAAGLLHGARVAGALQFAAEAARAVVLHPVEGTILTAMSSAADRSLAVRGGPAARLRAAAAAAHRAAMESPGRLPVLAEAGVVDAGALGFAVAIEAMAASLRGAAPRPLSRRLRGLAPSRAWRATAAASVDHERPERCVQFSLTSPAIDREALSRELGGLGDSVLIAGDGSGLRVHIHTPDLAGTLVRAADFGAVDAILTMDIDAAAGRFLHPLARTGVVAIVEGHGWRRLFESFGAAVVESPPGSAPGAQAIARAVNACVAEVVVVLPDSPDACAAAGVAAKAAARRALVLPVFSLPAGLAALLARDPDENGAVNADAMIAAAGAVRVATTGRAMEDVVAAVEREIGLANLLTLYQGASVSRKEAAAVAARVRDRWPDLAVEAVAGGQRDAAYILAFEE